MPMKFSSPASVAAAVTRRFTALRQQMAMPSLAWLQFAAVITFTLSPAALPTIVSPPPSISQINGFPAWFSVTATDAPPLSFQGRRGGKNVVGATSNVFGWPAVQPSNTGSYDVVVTDVSCDCASLRSLRHSCCRTVSCNGQPLPRYSSVMTKKILATLLSLGAAVANAAGNDLIGNGSFESGTNGWILSGTVWTTRLASQIVMTTSMRYWRLRR